jgi:hypothetical protein
MEEWGNNGHAGRKCGAPKRRSPKLLSNRNFLEQPLHTIAVNSRHIVVELNPWEERGGGGPKRNINVDRYFMKIKKLKNKSNSCGYVIVAAKAALASARTVLPYIIYCTI